MSNESPESPGAAAEKKVNAETGPVEAYDQKGEILPHQQVLEGARRQGAVGGAPELLNLFNTLSLTGSPVASKIGGDEEGPSELVKDHESGNADAKTSGSKALALEHPRKQAELLKGSPHTKNVQGTQVCVNKYGIPRPPQNPKSVLQPSLGLVVSPEEGPVVFKSWPERGAREDSRIAKRRTIILTGLPEQSTLEVITAICKGTGPVESIKFSPVTRERAAITFVSAAVAERFYRRTANGVEVAFPGGSTRHLVSVDLDREAAVLPSVLRERIDRGATRVVRVVGWRRHDVIEFLKAKGSLPAPDVSFNTIVWKVAMIIAQGNQLAVESAKWDKNHLGYLVMLLTFSNLTTAYQGFCLLKREEAFEECNVQFADDP